ncbi:TetR/AcrR family transcriptional regulator [Rhodococcus opacus]|uniref:TetR/AcrR family transcriptional regulator n=1 Tax=Rhodococcus opacus TaxID=37919 RepID=UPI001F59FFD6|nr:TetR/AcrR family transcriptional regulator [Rhodococcus opacus]UNN03395.1 TetR/AcrR family transcriptional regulator [Rhodococcus opacus]
MTAWSSANTNRSCSTARTEADVSTRTIYNHFEGKEQLFFAVIEDSATRVADSQTDMIDRHLGEVNDLESYLVALGREWVTIPTQVFADHFATAPSPSANEVSAIVTDGVAAFLDGYRGRGN